MCVFILFSAINVTISVEPPSKILLAIESSGNSIHKINVMREKGVEIKCAAPVSSAQMTW